MSKKPEPAFDPKHPVPFKALLPWEDLIALKQEALARRLTIGEVIGEALRARITLVDRSKEKKS